MAATMKQLEPGVPIMLLTGFPDPPESDDIDDFVTKGTLVPEFLRHVSALVRQ
jgi:hypothetical protein